MVLHGTPSSTRGQTPTTRPRRRTGHGSGAGAHPSMRRTGRRKIARTRPRTRSRSRADASGPEAPQVLLEPVGAQVAERVADALAATAVDQHDRGAVLGLLGLRLHAERAPHRP